MLIDMYDGMHFMRYSVFTYEKSRYVYQLFAIVEQSMSFERKLGKTPYICILVITLYLFGNSSSFKKSRAKVKGALS